MIEVRVRMVQQISGHRADGSRWPAPGEEFEVSDGEGASLVHAGIAVPVPVPQRAAETRPAPPEPAAEVRAEDGGVADDGFATDVPWDDPVPAPQKRSPGRPRKAP